MKRALLLAIVVATASAAIIPTASPAEGQSFIPIENDGDPEVAWDAEIENGEWKTTLEVTQTSNDLVYISFYEHTGGSKDPSSDPEISEDEFGSGSTEAATWSSDVPAGAPSTGVNEWYVFVEEYNGDKTYTSDVFTTTIPAVEVREEATNEPVDSQTEINATVTNDEGVSAETAVRSLGGDEVVPLTGPELDEELTPINQPITVDFRFISGSPVYGDRSVTYSNPQNETAWLAGGFGQDKVTATFELTDRTGDYEPETTVLQMTKTINGEQRQITGDLFGTNGRVRVSLNPTERYNVEVTNADGDTRSFGQYRADTENDLVDIEIGEIPINADEEDGPLFQAYETTGFAITGGLKVERPAIKFRYLDRDELTEELTVRIYEQNNESNQLYSNTFFSANEVQTQVNMSEINDEKSWVVEYTADRGNATETGTRIVGGLGELEAPIDGPVLQSVALGSLLLVAGLFGGRLSRIGGVVVVAIAWVLWTIGWLAMPAEFLVAAAVIAVLFQVAGGSARGVPA